MKTYKCKAEISVTVQANDEFDAPYEAGMHLDLGDIDWEVEEVNEQSDKLKVLSISIACLLDEPTDISISDIEHLQDLVTKIENTL